MNCAKVLLALKQVADSGHRMRMSGFGIVNSKALGVAVPKIRSLARQLGTDHALAQQLWKTEVHEARILATLVADPNLATSALLDRWAKQSNSWDITDGFCANLACFTRFAHEKAVAWAVRDEEFVRRAGFALMAALAVHDKRVCDREFELFLPVIEAHAEDERNFVKKAANWALRQIGKRNAVLNRKAIATATSLAQSSNATARWIGADALRELTSERIQASVRAKLARLKSR